MAKRRPPAPNPQPQPQPQPAPVNNPAPPAANPPAPTRTRRTTTTTRRRFTVTRDQFLRALVGIVVIVLVGLLIWRWNPVPSTVDITANGPAPTTIVTPAQKAADDAKKAAESEVEKLRKEMAGMRKAEEKRKAAEVKKTEDEKRAAEIAQVKATAEADAKKAAEVEAGKLREKIAAMEKELADAKTPPVPLAPAIMIQPRPPMASIPESDRKEELLAQLCNVGLPREQRIAIAKELANFRTIKVAKTVEAVMLQDRDSAVRCVAAEALGLVGCSQNLAGLEISATRDPNEHVRAAAERSLGIIQSQEGIAPQRVQPPNMAAPVLHNPTI